MKKLATVFSAEFIYPAERLVCEHPQNPCIDTWIDWPRHVETVIQPLLNITKEVRAFAYQPIETEECRQLAIFLERNFSKTSHGLLAQPDDCLFIGKGAEYFWRGSAGYGFDPGVDTVAIEAPTKTSSSISAVLVIPQLALDQLFQILNPFKFAHVIEGYFSYKRFGDYKDRDRFTRVTAHKGDIALIPHFGVNSIMQIRVARAYEPSLKGLYPAGAKIDPERGLPL